MYACSNSEHVWADEALRDNWDALASLLPPEWMPVRFGDVRFAEHGCGNYGCVYRTGDPSSVLKITSDESEADFISLRAVLDAPGHRPEGVADYRDIFELPTTRVDTKHNRRMKVYALVREAADGFGYLSTGRRRDYDVPIVMLGENEPTDTQRFVGRLDEFMSIAREIQRLTAAFKLMGENIVDVATQWIEEHGDLELDDYLWLTQDAMRSRKGFEPASHSLMQSLAAGPLQPDSHLVIFPRGTKKAERAVVLLKAAGWYLTRMVEEPVGAAIGQALRHYMRRGLILADVHTKNVGLVRRSGHGTTGGYIWAITDPGLLVRVSRDLPDSVRPQTIAEARRALHGAA